MTAVVNGRDALDTPFSGNRATGLQLTLPPLPTLSLLSLPDELPILICQALATGARPVGQSTGAAAADVRAWGDGSGAASLPPPHPVLGGAELADAWAVSHPSDWAVIAVPPPVSVAAWRAAAGVRGACTRLRTMWKCAIAHVDAGRALAVPVSVALATGAGALSGLSVLTVDGSDEARGDGGSLYRLLPTVVDRLRGFRCRGEELPASVKRALEGAMRRRLGDRGTAGFPLWLLHVVVSEQESVTGILNLVAQDGLRDVVVHVQQDLGYGPFDGATEADCSGDDVVGALCGHPYWPYEGPPATRWLAAALQSVAASRQTVAAGPAASPSPSRRLEALRRLSVDGLSAGAARVLASAAPRLGCIRVIDGVTGSFGGAAAAFPPC